MRKNRFFIGIIILCFNNTGDLFSSFNKVSQDPTSIVFSYDNAGNRVSRIVYYEEEDEGLKSLRVDSETPEEKIEIPGVINLFPNPAKYEISISLNKEVLDAENRRILIYDMQGKKIRDIVPQSFLVEINVSKMSQGSYIVKLIYGELVNDWMLIKQ
ncbi:MAG: T9SS type A sorting domain-containing protein [Bacteroidales bacterium]|nr:T9SS type A sorting domain-containing protein [Bacteroidales bacterium]MCF8389697.1 T9SS type A sorting domain-containing protein [Bacteroidales bacterium]